MAYQFASKNIAARALGYENLDEASKNLGLSTEDLYENVNPTKTLSPYYSSEKGQTLVQNATTDLNQLSTREEDDVETDGKKVTSGGGLTLDEANEAGGGDLSNYKFNDDGTYSPKPVMTDAEKAVESAKKDYEQFMKQLRDFGFAEADTSGIASAYDARIAQMERTNESREKAVLQTGIRSGSRWTGGAGGVWGSILSGEEIAGIKRLKELQAEKMAAISAAKAAAKENKWSKLVTLTNFAKSKYSEQLEALSKLNEDQAKQDEELQKEDSIYNAMADTGSTDPLSIYQYIREKGGKVTMKEIDDFMKVASPSEDLKGLSTDYRTYQYLKDIKDPSVEGMTYFNYVAAVSAAGRKPEDGDGDKGADFEDEDRRILTGAGFSPADITDLKAAVNDFGIDQVLGEITDPTKKAAIQKVFNITPKVTKDQIKAQVTLKAAQEGLQSTYTEDEIKDLAWENGFKSFWGLGGGDTEAFLNSEKAQELYVELLYNQYKTAGMTEE